jgi:hypothetical protein
MGVLFGARRAGVADVPVVARAMVPGSAPAQRIYGWGSLIGAVALALAAVGAGIAHAVERSADAADVGTGWIKTAVVTGGTAVFITVRWAMTNRQRRELFASPQPLRRVDVYRSSGAVFVRSPKGRDDALEIPAKVQPEDVISAASLYGEPVAGGWCAVEVNGEVVMPTGPSKVSVWIGPGSVEWQRYSAEKTSAYREHARFLEKNLNVMRRLRANLPPDHRGDLDEQIRGTERQLADLRQVIDGGDGAKSSSNP